MSKIIISCAITGSIHVPSQSPHLPYRPDDIATSAIGAAQAGAAILHLHARHPETGRPSSDPAHWASFLPQIAQNTDAVINMTTGGSAIMTLDQRLAAPKANAPEMCSLNMGSMNFALYPMLARIKHFKFDWEQSFLENSDDVVFKNTPRDIAHVLTEMGQQRGARFEFECYDIGHLTMLKHFVDRGLIEGPIFIQFVFGVLGGMAPEPDTLALLKRTADRMFGDSLPILRPRRRPRADSHGHHVRSDGRPRPRRAGGQPLHLQRPTGPLQRPASHPDPRDRRTPGPHHRHPRRGPPDACPQGPRQDDDCKAMTRLSKYSLPTHHVVAILLMLGRFPSDPQTYEELQAFRDCPDCPEMVVLPMGSFTMGAPPDEFRRMLATTSHILRRPEEPPEKGGRGPAGVGHGGHTLRHGPE